MKSAGFAFAIILILLIAGALFFGNGGSGSAWGRPKYKTVMAMQLQGKWLGMTLVSTDSLAARKLNLSPSVNGVMVVDIKEKKGWRARQAGLLEGDIVQAVNGKSVKGLTDLYSVSLGLDIGSSIILDVQRWGQPMKLALPALYTSTSPTGMMGGVLK